MNNLLSRVKVFVIEKIMLLHTDQRGMSTVEYAIGTIAAAAFGAVLYSIVTGSSVTSALENIIKKALNTDL